MEEWRVGIDHQAARRDVLRTRATVERAQQESGPGGSAEQRVRLYESVGRKLRPEVKVGEVRILDQAELAPVLQTELHLVLALNMREFGAETGVFGVLDPVETVADRGIADIQSWVINLRQVLDIGRVPATRPEASEIARVNLDIRRIIIIVDRAVAAADVKHRRRADHIHALAIRIQGVHRASIPSGERARLYAVQFLDRVVELAEAAEDSPFVANVPVRAV